uniref:ATP-dependent DNA helicase n=1 Tax=Tanacetum cinerariifolium TaxID=118510 RepID=A0A699IIX1_TANCI|nr:DNA helicase [Tanacetum cinerariifolium]
MLLWEMLGNQKLWVSRVLAHMGNINDAGLCSAGNVIDDVGFSFHVDEFIGTRGLQTLVASSSENRKRTRDVMYRMTTSNLGSSSSSTRHRLHSGHHSANTSVSNDDSVFLVDASNVHTNDFSLRGNRTGPPLEYKDVGKCDHSCEHCGAHFATGRLFQQYMVTAFCVVEQSRIHYIHDHQNDIRNDYLSSIYNAIRREDSDGFDCGGRFILQQSFTGGPRYMYAHYLDALSIFRVHENPTYFIKFTCNVKWIEITDNIVDFLGVTTADKADIVDRIFEMKIHQFVKYLRDSKPFGKIIAIVYTVEFQKRGLPHWHTLVWIDEASRTQNQEEIDNYISVELPSEKVDPEGHRVIAEFMIHGPCGEICPIAACMKNSSRCTKHFLKEYCHNTYIYAVGFVRYRIRDTRITTTKYNIKLDNGRRSVLPTNDTFAPERMSKLPGHTYKTQELIFVYGHGGTGKTFLWKTIIYALRAEGKIVIAVASSGIASLLLPSSRTAHSRFKLPLDLNDSSVCSITKNTQLATLLKETDLIVWDESPMNDRRCFETLDRTLQDILDTPTTLFGGKPIMLGGDFRQTLPVKKKASRTEIITSLIAESYNWPSFRLFVLTENMLLTQGTLSDIEKRNDENDVTKLINFIYDEHTLLHPTAKDLQDKAFVCPKNDTADVINAKIMNMLLGHNTTYISNDEAMPYGHDGSEVELLYPTEYLNTLNFVGIPSS